MPSRTSTAITNVEPISARLQAKLDEQGKRISQLEQQNQQVIEELQKTNYQNQLEIESLKIN